MNLRPLRCRLTGIECSVRTQCHSSRDLAGYRCRDQIVHQSPSLIVHELQEVEWVLPRGSHRLHDLGANILLGESLLEWVFAIG